MRAIEPSPDRTQALTDGADAEGPIVMINLLRYRDAAGYAPDADAEPCSGREAYGRYGAGVAPLLEKAGARPVWMGAARSTVIAPQGEHWDDAILVEYPSRRAFLEMISSAAYQAVSIHRTAALDDSRLIETTTVFAREPQASG